MCICVCMCTRVNTCAYACERACARTCSSVYMCAHAHVRACMCVLNLGKSQENQDSLPARIPPPSQGCSCCPAAPFPFFPRKGVPLSLKLLENALVQHQSSDKSSGVICSAPVGLCLYQAGVRPGELRTKKGHRSWWGMQRSKAENERCACSAQALRQVRLFATPRTVAHQAPLSMKFQARILEWVAFRDLPNLHLLHLPALVGSLLPLSH